MNAEVLIFDGFTKLDLPPKQILNEAKKADLELAIVIGIDKNGELYFASSKADGADVLWWIEKAKKALLDI
jgi:hypothetical protein